MKTINSIGTVGLLASVVSLTGCGVDRGPLDRKAGKNVDTPVESSTQRRCLTVKRWAVEKTPNKRLRLVIHAANRCNESFSNVKVRIKIWDADDRDIGTKLVDLGPLSGNAERLEYVCHPETASVEVISINGT